MKVAAGWGKTVVVHKDILLVDDHPLFVGGFVEMARTLRPGWRVRTANSSREAGAQLGLVHPDVAVVDINLPDSDGFKLLEKFRIVVPTVPVLLISGREDVAVRVRARTCGAAGFLAKVCAPPTIVEAIESVLAGGTAFDLDLGDHVPELTARQAEILLLLAQGHGNKEIRYRLGIAERTVRAHLTTLFQLLGAYSRGQAVARGRELGLIP